jgi:hypothetical protein
MSSKSSQPKASSKPNGKNKNKQKRNGAGPQLQATQGAGGRVMTKSLMSHPIFGGRLTSNTDSIPSAFVNILGNSTYFGEGSKVLMPELGLDPVNIVGCQPLSDVTGSAGAPDVFTTGTLATASTVNLIYMSPDTFNGPLAARANLYDKYVFRDILIEYVSTCATSQANAIGIGIMEDGSGLGAPTSFSTVRQLVPSVAFPLRTDRAFLHWHYRGPQLYWTAADTASNAAGRLTLQGAISAFASANLTVIVPGFFNVYYSIDLYNPVLSQGFTVSVNRRERDVLREVLQAIREMKPDDQERALEDVRLRLAPTEFVQIQPPRSGPVPKR